MGKCPPTDFWDTDPVYYFTSPNIKSLSQVAFPIQVTDPNVRQDVHSVSSLLKLYFRELPDPLCTYKAYEEFLEAAKLPEDLRLSAMRQVLSTLPKENFRTLEYLMRHLHKVSLKGHDTGMTAKNLAIVWAPNLLRTKEVHKPKNNNNNLKGKFLNLPPN